MIIRFLNRDNEKTQADRPNRLQFWVILNVETVEKGRNEMMARNCERNGLLIWFVRGDLMLRRRFGFINSGVFICQGLIRQSRYFRRR